MIHFETDGKVGTLTLDLNAQNTFSLPGLISLLERLKNLNGCKILILRSGQPGIFSAGLDLESLTGEKSREELTQFLDLFYENLKLLYSLPIPTISLITGHALGYGAMLTLVTDFRMALGNTRLGLPEVKLGIPVPNFIYQILADSLGFHKAKEMVLLGDSYKAKDLPEIFTDVLESEEKLAQSTKSLLSTLGKNSFTAMAFTKQGILKKNDFLLETIQTDIQVTLQALQSSDAKEGLSAAASRRRPNFS